MARELITVAALGYAAGAGSMLVFLRIMIRGALNGLEDRLTTKFDRRYRLVPREQERASVARPHFAGPRPRKGET